MRLGHEDGIKWIEEQVDATAAELGIQLDGPPEWDTRDPLNFRMAVEVAGQRRILPLSRFEIEDSQGRQKKPTLEVRARLQAKIRKFLESFSPPKRRIGF